MRAAMLAALIVGCLIANQVHAQTGSGQTQSLTRVDCVQAGMAWDEAANVCGSAAQAAEARPNAQAAQPSPPSEVTDGSSQPLTRHECDRTGMAWDDTANVCSEQSDETASQIKPEPEAAAPAILVNIDKTNQTMTVHMDGVQHYEWPVSTGLRGYTTPSGSYTASSLNEIWYSQEWDNAPMPHAIFFTKKGHAIHGTEETSKLGRPASHGCVRLAPENARTLFSLVKANGLENTKIVLSGHTPGGESNVTTVASRKEQGKSAKSRNKFKRFEVERGFGRRGWFRRHYAGPREWPAQPFYMGRRRVWR